MNSQDFDLAPSAFIRHTPHLKIEEEEEEEDTPHEELRALYQRAAQDFLRSSPNSRRCSSATYGSYTYQRDGDAKKLEDRATPISPAKGRRGTQTSPEVILPLITSLKAELLSVSNPTCRRTILGYLISLSDLIGQILITDDMQTLLSEPHISSEELQHLKTNIKSIISELETTLFPTTPFKTASVGVQYLPPPVLKNSSVAALFQETATADSKHPARVQKVSDVDGNK